MTEKMLSAVEHLLQVINNKATNLSIAAGVVVAGQTAKDASASEFKSLSEISLSELFMHELSVASIISLIGCAYIVLQLLNLCGFFKAIKWVYNKLLKRQKID